MERGHTGAKAERLRRDPVTAGVIGDARALLADSEKMAAKLRRTALTCDPFREMDRLASRGTSSAANLSGIDIGAA